MDPDKTKPFARGDGKRRISEDQNGRTADLEKLMAPYVTSQSWGGGLGLYLSKKVVMARGESLSLARMGHGARVMINVPQKRIET